MSTHRVLISVKPAFAFRNLLNRRLQGGAASCDDVLFMALDVCRHGGQIKRDRNVQGPSECLSP